MTEAPSLLRTFIARVDRYAARRGVTRAWVSKRLFNDAGRVDDLAGGCDVGVRRLKRARVDLVALERELVSDAGGAPEARP